MDLHLTNSRFIVTGAGSGFGKAITTRLLQEGARVLALSRTAEKLEELQHSYPSLLEVKQADVLKPEALVFAKAFAGEGPLSGLVVNAGGPPAVSAREASLTQWDEAYQLLLRWKVEFTKALLPFFEEQGFGRLLFIESASVKQPMDNLVLSTSFRLAVTGFARTLASESASKGITVNVLAPGFHDTPAVDRIFRKQAEQQGISQEDARERLLHSIPVQRMGKPDELASLACWLLSPLSGFVTAQTISLDGGQGKYLFG